MRGGCPPVATSVCKPPPPPLCSGCTHGRDFRFYPPVTHFRVFSFLGCSANLSHFVSLLRNPIRPVASSPTPSSDSQVELESRIKDPPPLPDQDEWRTVRVKIQLRKECQFGEQFFIVGSQQELGLWNPLDAVPMTWSEGHVWTAELDIPIGNPVQFKFILRDMVGKLLWQPGKDRVIHTWKTSKIISVFEDWENAEAQQVTGERVIDKYEDSDALKYKTEQVIHSHGKCNEEHKLVVETCHTTDSAHSVACTNKETVAIVAENNTDQTTPDLDILRTSEGKRSQTESSAENLGIQVVDESIISHTMADVVANLDTSDDILEKREAPVLVPGLNSCLTTPMEDVTAEEPKLDEMREEVNGHTKQEEAMGRLKFNDDHATTTTKHLNAVASSYDEDMVVKDNPDQDLESALFEGESSPLRNDMKWRLKSFFDHLGFL